LYYEELAFYHSDSGVFRSQFGNKLVDRKPCDNESCRLEHRSTEQYPEWSD